MQPLGYHIRLRLKNNAVIARDREERLVVARSVLERDPDLGLVAFGLPDRHLHMGALGDKPTCTELARDVEISINLALKPKTGFAEPYLKPVFDDDQLRGTFFYVLSQLVRHGLLHLDPLGEGTNIPDLLGARVLGRHTREKMLAHLPRVQPAALLECIKLPLVPETDLPLELIGEAAAAAVGMLAPRGKSRIIRAARRAAMEVAGGKLQLKTLASALGCSTAALKRQREDPADQHLVQAVRWQLRMRAALASRREQG